MPTKTPDRVLILLCQDFRHHLEQFYASLNLAPPYHSLEKAIRHLSFVYDRKTSDEREHLYEDLNLKWRFYEEIFIESGLPQKHRGIIRGLIESESPLSIPTQYGPFINAFHPQTQRRSGGS